LKKNLHILIFVLGAIASMYACEKGGPGGSGSISGICYHHSRVIPNDSVAIKYGAKNLPGVTPADYDKMIMADSTGHFKFGPLTKGNYYLYGWGFDTALGRAVTGGIPVTLNSNSDNVTIDLPITERD
jgi:hypothetical protein